jgi:hypothetical protein
MLVTVVFWGAAAPAGVASENDDVEVKGRLSLGGAGQAISGGTGCEFSISTETR